MSLSTLSDLEQLIKTDDEPEHGICPICYPLDTITDESKLIAVCGVEVTDNRIIPFRECVNVCAPCLAGYTIHKRTAHGY